MARAPAPPLPDLACPDADAWERWLDEHHAAAPGVWLLLAKKGGGARSVSHREALDLALCFGWIDGQVRARNAAHYAIRFTPRGRRSIWSQINRDRATALIEAGRMRPSGLAAVEAARADGRWAAAYAPQSRATVPEDLQRALDVEPDAASFFATLTGSRRYAFLHRLHHVTAPERRAQRIADYVALLRDGRNLN
jgi:uncharacterized protein YdeI (YjbR/CyaY-like superfamily)